MPRINETGHSVNYGNFGKLITICEGYGTSYNPSNNAISLASLKAKFTDTTAALNFVAEKETNLLRAVNARAALLNPLKNLCTRMVNAFSASGADYRAVNDLKGIHRLIQGARANRSILTEAAAKEADGTPSGIKIRSVSRQGIDQMIENFSRMITMVKSEKLYKPNEADLKVAALEAYYADLKAKDNAVDVAQAEYKKALQDRDNVMYAPDSGLVDVSKVVKRYAKSVFGANSNDFKKLNVIYFRRQ